MWEAKVTSVETLGGNHTRLAIQGLLESSDITDAQAVVKVRLYRDLTKVEALQIGYLHNKQAANSKDLSFFDKIRIMRPLLYGVEAKSAELTARKDKVRIIFDLKVSYQFNILIKCVHLCSNWDFDSDMGFPYTYHIYSNKCPRVMQFDIPETKFGQNLGYFLGFKPLLVAFCSPFLSKKWGKNWRGTY